MGYTITHHGIRILGIALIIPVVLCMFSCANNNSTDDIGNAKEPILDSNVRNYKIDSAGIFEEVKHHSTELNFGNRQSEIDITVAIDNPIIDDLNNNEFLVLIYHSRGCFGGEENKMVFKKINNKIYCITNENSVVIVDDTTIKEIKKFESLLAQINKHSNFCTTVSSYSFHLGKRVRTYIDDTCDYRDLFNTLFSKLHTVNFNLL